MHRRQLRATATLTGALAVGVLLASCGASGDTVGSDIPGVVVEDGQTNNHVANATYTEDPPTGGDHNPVWLDCDFYDVPVPNQNAVHSLEHGVVWLTHDPDLPADEVAQLRALFDSRSDRIIVSPYPGLDAPIVAVAWERRLEVDRADDPRLQQFIDTFVNGAQAPEPRAACTGGLGKSG